jgi:hypothetical protein
MSEFIYTKSVKLEQEVQAATAGQRTEQGTQATTAGPPILLRRVVTSLLRGVVAALLGRVVTSLLRRIVTPLLWRVASSLVREGRLLLVVVAHIRPRCVAWVVGVSAIWLLLIVGGLGRLGTALVVGRGIVVFVGHLCCCLWVG